MEVNELLNMGVIVLVGQSASKVRDRFLDSFVDTSNSWYKEKIEKRVAYSDGEFYPGYLWEALYHYRRVTDDELTAKARSLGTSYAFWDLHSADKIVVPDYWKFPREAVLQGDAAHILAGRELLPKDLYIVDASFSSCLILTHEYDEQLADIRLEAWPRSVNH